MEKRNCNLVLHHEKGDTASSSLRREGRCGKPLPTTRAQKHRCRTVKDRNSAVTQRVPYFWGSEGKAVCETCARAADFEDWWLPNNGQPGNYSEPEVGLWEVKGRWRLLTVAAR